MKTITISYTASNNQSFVIVIDRYTFTIRDSDGEYVGFVSYGGNYPGMSDALKQCSNIIRASRDEVVKFCDRVWKNQAFL